MCIQPSKNVPIEACIVSYIIKPFYIQLKKIDETCKKKKLSKEEIRKIANSLALKTGDANISQMILKFTKYYTVSLEMKKALKLNDKDKRETMLKELYTEANGKMFPKSIMDFKTFLDNANKISDIFYNIAHEIDKRSGKLAQIMIKDLNSKNLHRFSYLNKIRSKFSKTKKQTVQS